MEQIKQMERIVIIARDEPGVIAAIAKALADAAVNIESLNTEKAGDQGVLTLITDNTNQALHVLANAGSKRQPTTPSSSACPTNREPSHESLSASAKPGSTSKACTY